MRVNLNGILNFNKKFKIDDSENVKRTNIPSPVRGTLQLDTVEFSEPKSESFQDVFNEMRQNVPDRTTTIEEKELAISYIDRMLACSDITPELKTYWENKKVIIQNEIQNIINEHSIGTDSNFAALESEFWDYSNSVWNRPVEFDNVPDRVEYWLSYYNTCISYIDRLLNCEGITNEKRAEYQELRNSMLFDANNHKRDLNRYNQENGLQTESFHNVYRENGLQTESFHNVYIEMLHNVPDRTTTISEKQLALSYIDRMLSCGDINVVQKAFWTQQRAAIQKEIDNFGN